MSGLDPLAAAFAAQAVAGAQAAIDEAMLSLGADIPLLQAQVSVGDVIAATVLPPQGGSDLLSFLGQTVAAQIPPGIDPGESLLLQVTSFTSTAVIVKNLGIVDPQNPVPTVDVQLPQPVPGAPQSAILTNAPPPAAPAQAPQASPAVAPSREVFIAAAVRATPPSTTPPSPPSGTPPRTPVVAAVTPPSGDDVEARIAITRAGVGSSLPPQASPRQVPPQLPSPAAAPSDPRMPGRLPVAPPIVLSGSPRAAATHDTPEAALLSRLRVPITPATLAAARIAGTATTAMTSAYEKLDALLARAAAQPTQQMQQTPVALRAFLGFVSRMDLRNAAALPEQIAAFVSEVVDGTEAKIAQAVQAWLSIAPVDPPEETPNVPGAPLAAQQQPETAMPTPAQVTTAAAQAAERSVALSFDPKSVMMSLLADPSQSASSASAAIAGALRDAVTATTAVQLGALASQNVEPNAVTLALPAYFYAGGSPVQLRISRDAPEAKKKMDADNFHIAFVLDTASLGTVAIDVQTVGRAVSVDVKTQGSSAADRFRASFGDLRGRLEKLRYRVAAIGAGTAAPLGVRSAQPPAQAQTERSGRAFWDTRA